MRKRITVSPASALTRHAALLSALTHAFPVTFISAEAVDHGESIDGQLTFAPEPMLQPERRAADEYVPSLLVLDGLGSPPLAAGTQIEFSDDEQVPRPLRGRAIMEHSAAISHTAKPAVGDRVLACADGAIPVWWARAGEGFDHVALVAPEMLSRGHALRDHLTIGRFIGLLPLIELIRNICGGPQPGASLRASFVVDDPNLHWPSYGHLNYRTLVAHARRHGYHLGIAMVPLDGWRTSRRAAALVRSSADVLSVLVHGNDHLAGELGRLTESWQAERVLAQALRRVARFERRIGVPVQRVMVPPHESCSMVALRAMFKLGYDGACIGRRHPWFEHEPERVTAQQPLLGWRPLELLAGGMPVLGRSLLDYPWEDLAFRALLGQPLILFGHHWDFKGGLDQLAEAAAYIDGLGEVSWGPLGSITQNAFRTSREGETMHVEMNSRRITVRIPAGVRTLRVRTPGDGGEAERHLVHPGGRSRMAHDGFGWTAELDSSGLARTAGLVVEPASPLDPEQVPSARLAPWAALRRGLVEGRDRVQPLARTLTRKRR